MLWTLVQGSRPVTLVGFSMGARVIFHCLEALYKKGDAVHGIVENAVLLGTPIGRSLDRYGFSSRLSHASIGFMVSIHGVRCSIWKFLGSRPKILFLTI
jgi:pimeloyl-ACP methyl ester carboxylesterase